MDGETGKFDRMSMITSRLTEKNRDALVKTAKSLLRIQRETEALLGFAGTEGKEKRAGETA
ncbi:MAG: hypothetical protein Pg6C_12520 [Treponemataceae bacterium]|nr:MAG: hypothetical protein Pg6C_12520 [Treponemataceae bacterium]